MSPLSYSAVLWFSSCQLSLFHPPKLQVQNFAICFILSNVIFHFSSSQSIQTFQLYNFVSSALSQNGFSWSHWFHVIKSNGHFPSSAFFTEQPWRVLASLLNLWEFMLLLRLYHTSWFISFLYNHSFLSPLETQTLASL